MKYSVYDWSRKTYRVYADERPWPVMADSPTCVAQARGAIGMVDVNMAICPVPTDARFVGWSQVAEGRVSRLMGGMAGVPAGWAGGGQSLGGGGFVVPWRPGPPPQAPAAGMGGHYGMGHAAPPAPAMGNARHAAGAPQPRRLFSPRPPMGSVDHIWKEPDSYGGAWVHNVAAMTASGVLGSWAMKLLGL